MSIATSAVAVTTSAQLLYNADSGTNVTIEVVNPTGNTVTVYIGDATVTTATGRPVEPGQSVAVDILGNDDIYIIAASAVSVRLVVLT